MKYRTKPIEVEAVCVDDGLLSSPESRPEWLRFLEACGLVWAQADSVYVGDDGRGNTHAERGDWLVCHGEDSDGYPIVQLVRAADFAARYELALPPGFTPPRADRPAGYQFGLDERIKLPPGSPTMLETLKEQRQ